MPGKLEGKVALITGGSSGIGMATAREFASEGAQVYITGRRKPELDAAAAALGSGVTAIQGDVSKPKDLDRIYGQIGQEKGHVDIVFANAGVADFAPIGSITEEHFDKIFGINVKGAMLTAQKALPLMPDGGTILRAHLDNRSQRPRHQGQRRQPRSHRHTDGLRELRRPPRGARASHLGRRLPAPGPP